MRLDVELGFTPDGEKLTRELCEQLVGEMFDGRPDIGQVRLGPLPDGHAGYSSLILLQAKLYGADGSERNPLLIRIGPRELIAAEKQRYAAYVDGLTGSGKVPQWPDVQAGSLGAIAYDYVRGSGNQPPMSLRDFLAADESQAVNLDRACKAVTTLFRDTLAQAPQANGWYADGRPYEQQRPLWFYNTVLPPTVKLHDVRPIDEPDADIALTDCLAFADTPACTLLDGKPAST